MEFVKPHKILFTGHINENHCKFGKKLGLLVESYPFICTTLHVFTDDEIIEIHEHRKQVAWIFTSKNAVKALAAALPNFSAFSDVTCYAVGENTAFELQKHKLYAQVPKHHHVQSLVTLLEQNVRGKYCFYFSGNLRKNTIPKFFEEKKIAYREIESYKTELVQPDVEVHRYDAICFCSPSAAESFFKKYRPKPAVPCVAIGNTTAVQLLNYTDHVIMSEETNIYSMLTSCKTYLNF